MAAPDSVRSLVEESVGELTTWSFSFALAVPDGGGGSRPPLLAEITALTLTVYLAATGASIVGHASETLTDVNIKNTGRGAYSESTGVLTVLLHALDNPVVDAALAALTGALERHVALVEATYNSGADVLRKEIAFDVRSLARVPV